MTAISPDGSHPVKAGGAAAMNDSMFEDHAAIEAEQIVDHYLMGRLPREEGERFERHYLSCPQCLEQLELGEKLLAGLRLAAAQDIKRAGVAATLLLAYRRLGRWQAPLAALAVAGVLLSSGLLYRQLRRAGGELEGLRAELRAPQINLPLITLSPRRGDVAGAEPSHRLRLPAEPGSIVLLLELDLPAGAACRALLSGAAGEIRWRGDGLLADSSGNLVLALPTTFFPAGDHLLRIEDPVTGDALAHFPLRVLPPR